MQLSKYVVALALLLITTAVNAEQAVSVEHSSVHVVFILPNAVPAQFDNSAPGARLGDVIVPVESVRPISITIDGEFVGHALVSYQNVQPVFILPSGAHEFKFTCDGFEPTSIKMKALGGGSKQFLVVKMDPGSPDASNKPDREARPAATATGQ